MSCAYEGKKVLIAGLGRSGRSAAAFLLDKKARITVYDCRSEHEIGKITFAAEKILALPPQEVDVCRFDIIVVSPGIPPHNPIIKNALDKGIPLKSELQVGLEFCPSVKIAAITGTNGKTTTCSLLQYLTGGRVAGNIGSPLTGEVEKLKKGDFLILEVSSYQIPFTESLAPDIAVLLNLFPEHIEWHGSQENYIYSKMQMFLRQSSSQNAVFNSRLDEVNKFSSEIKSKKMFFDSEGMPSRGTGITKGKIFFLSQKGKEFLCPVEKFPLSGRHNIENLLAALCVSKLAGFEEIPDLDGFKPPANRMERIGKFKGVEYINDSKATNLHSVLSALETLPGPLILLMGGRSKGVKISSLAKVGAGKIKKVVAFGESAGEVTEMFKEKVPVHETRELKDAVKIAVNEARPGFTVIMSPGGSSFDQYENYIQRGEEFKKCVIQQAKKY